MRCIDFKTTEKEKMTKANEQNLPKFTTTQEKKKKKKKINKKITKNMKTTKIKCIDFKNNK